jgi:dTDP-4-amino-4,6-dideoxygalactose transaminase
MDPQSLVEKITPRTVGVIPVHLYGQAAQMDRILKIAQQYKLWVIEDCAQAHLAKYQGRNVGTFGDVATFSFYPGKNLGAMGDAGAILTKDLMLAKKMAMYARHGGLNKGDHQIEGINSRMDGIQAAILNAKIPHLDKWTRSRQRIAFTYINKLSHINTITLPTIRDGSEHVWHLFVITHAKRDLLSRHLNEHGISTSINYPLSLPFLPAYSRYNHVPHDFPNSFRCQNEILSLPIYPEMTDQSINKILNAIIEFN